MTDKTTQNQLPQSNRTPVSDQVSMLSETGSRGSPVLNRIGREIVDGTFAPDTRLPEEAVMLKRYAVSRTALREAYSKLAGKGLIHAKPKVGTMVRPPAFWNMLDSDVLSWHLQTRPVDEIARDLYALRCMVEPQAAALAAGVRTEEEMQKIEAAYKDMQDNSHDEGGLVEADLRFHLEILFATHNHFIGAFSALIHAAMMSTFRLSWKGAEADVIRQERLLQHGKVLDAIRAGDAKRAESVMQNLLDESLDDVSEAFET